MADVIRQRIIQSVNRSNKWPSNGMFTRTTTSYQNIDRQWLNVAIHDFPMLVGNIFEQTDFPMVTYMICARRDYSNDNLPVINACVDKVSIGVMPIECRERHSIEQYLSNKISKELYLHDYIEFHLFCYVKGWFWE